jgi:hypothetical protein
MKEIMPYFWNIPDYIAFSRERNYVAYLSISSKPFSCISKQKNKELL